MTQDGQPDILPEPTDNDRATYPFTPLDERNPEVVPSNGRPEPLVPRISWVLTFFATLVGLALFVPFLAERVQYSITRGRQRAEIEVATAGLAAMPAGNLSLASQLVSKRISPSVVHIDVVNPSTQAGVQAPSNSNHPRLHNLPDGPGQPSPGQPDGWNWQPGTGQPERGNQPKRRRLTHPVMGAGSGVIVDPSGYILTNYHVISEAAEIRVTLSDDRTVRARVAGIDPPTDLALLKIEVDGLAAAEWGDSDKLESGALVWAVGSPFGFRQSITLGIVSATNREMSATTRQLKANYSDYLQTDAAINPGNSGGPLVDGTGKVVGINTAIIGESFSGASFAIPSRVAHAVFQKLKTNGKIERGWLGVAMESVNESRVAEYRLAVDEGALVLKLTKQSPARQAGIQVEDVIVRWAGKPVTDHISLVRLVAATKVGERVEVVVIRGSERLSFQVTVGTRPAESVLERQ